MRGGIKVEDNTEKLAATWKIVFQMPDQRKGEAYVEESYRDTLIESLVTNDVAILSVNEII